MKFSVRWVPAAEEELADIWLTAVDRQGVTAASHEIDVRLRTSPETEGESRGDNFRILIVSPLGVKYEVKADDLLVQVLHVWQFSRRTS